MSSFDKAMAAYSSAGKYGEEFTTFTNNLLSGVVDTLVQSGIDQMVSYAKLVQSISVGLEAFQANATGLNLQNEADPDNLIVINDYIENVLGIDLANSPISVTEVESAGLADHFNGITIVDTENNDKVSSIMDVLISTPDSSPALVPYPITTGELQKFVWNKLLSNSANNYSTLVTLVREGWIKILPSKWEVSTDLSFHITSSDTFNANSSLYKNKASSWAINHSGSVGFNLGKILSLSNNYSGSANRSKLTVSTSNSSSASAITSDVLFKGHVRIDGVAVQHPSITIE